jgi:radical SAM protein with 4Fe4S-binding SPASM domain
MKDAGINVKVSATLTQINKNSIWRLRRFCDQNNIGFRTSLFFIAGERSKRNIQWLGVDADEAWDALVYNTKHLNVDDSFVDTSFHEPGIRRYSCGVGYGTVAINPDGSLSPCNHLADSKLYLGNVRTSTLHQLVAVGYERYNFVDIDKMTSGSCTRCPVRYICAGGCRASSLHTYGTMHEAPPDCNFLKQAYIKSLWISVVGT